MSCPASISVILAGNYALLCWSLTGNVGLGFEKLSQNFLGKESCEHFRQKQRP
jgi:hypothetical protein